MNALQLCLLLAMPALMFVCAAKVTGSLWLSLPLKGSALLATFLTLILLLESVGMLS